MKNRIVYWIFPLLFLIIGLFTLSDYGLNWDSAKHYRKGQAYLHYILTGEETYEKLLGYQTLNPDIGPGPEDWEPYEVGQGRIYEEAVWDGWRGRRRSFYQAEGAGYINMIEGGLDGYSHPAGNDLSAAITNYIFFQKLGILGDYEAHNLFIVLISFVSVLAVSYFAYREFGKAASLMAGFFYGFYPLFFAEAHFNIKDPVITAYISLTIIIFYYAIKNISHKLLFLASMFAGLGLSTKLNIVFAPIIILPWLVLHLIKARRKLRKNTKFYLSFVLIPIIAFVAFILTWPYLWHDVLAGTAEMLLYYFDIGAGGNNLIYAPYTYLGINFYPIYYILITTPVPMLLLFFVGIAASTYQIFRKQNYIYVLVLSWFIFPIARVSTPQATIYGGVRQIMEYVPAMALLAGVGGRTIYSKINNQKAAALLLASLVGIMGWEMIKIHPNQNVYFNQLVGGLSGAAEKQIPYWGNSFGNAYLQGIEWLNKNAEPNAKVATVLFSDSELPFQSLRSDISLSNSYWSGPSLGGEYVIDLFLDNDVRAKYSYNYLETYLRPVYEAKSQGQSILKVWRNGPQYLEVDLRDYTKLDSSLEIDHSEQTGGNYIVDIDLGQNKNIGFMRWLKNTNCQIEYNQNIVYTSINGTEWQRLPNFFGVDNYPNVAKDNIDTPYLNSKDQITVLFPHVEARFIRIDLEKSNVCLVDEPKIEVWGSG